MDTIVVGYDGSEAAEHALTRAASFAQAFSARLVVVSVSRARPVPATVPLLDRGAEFAATPVGPVATGGPRPSPALGDRDREAKELAQRQLEKARTTLSRLRVEAVYVAEVGLPTERILDVADEHNADLIVVGSREHGVIERLLGRPVDEAVARHTGRDVLLVH